VRPNVYADATALIGLARIRRLDLLTLLRIPVYVPAPVWQEAVGDPAKAGVGGLLQAREAGLLAIDDEGDPTAYRQLGPGESSVRTAAAAVGAAVLIDERRARATINDSVELREAITDMTGIVGLILLAKDRGYIEAVRPLLDELVRQSFRISPPLYRKALRWAGE
jgi:predicted nucleic acid-binding protein